MLKRLIFAIAATILATFCLWRIVAIPGPASQAETFFEPPARKTRTEPWILATERSTSFSARLKTATMASPPESLRFLMGTYDLPTAQIVRGTFRTESGSCEYASEPGTVLENNTHLLLSKRSCDAYGGIMTLTFETAQPANIAFWSYLMPLAWPGSDSGMEIMDSRDLPSGKTRYVHGFREVQTTTPTMPRYELLAAMWDLGWDPKQFLLVVLGLGFVACASLGLCLNKVQPAVSAASAWLAMCGLYSILTPPFQAPDEPDHALGYAEQFSDYRLSDDMLQLAQESHFERIKFHPDVKFSSSSIGSPSRLPWSKDVTPVVMMMRSPITAYLWNFHRATMGEMRAAKTVLSLRFFNSAIAAFAVWLGLLFLRFNLSLVRAAALCLLVTPALPSFTMHVSNYFTIFALVFLQSCVVVRFLLSPTLTTIQLLTISLLTALAPFSGGVSIGQYLIWIPLLLWLLLDSRKSESAVDKTTRKSLAFKKAALLAAFPIMFFLLFRARQLQWVRELRLNFSSVKLPQPARESLALLAISLFILTTATIVSLFKARSAKQDTVARAFGSKAFRAGPAWLIVGLLTLANVLSIAGVNFSVPGIESGEKPLTAWLYARSVLKASFFNFTLFPVDPYLSTSYWVGFGWLESLPPAYATGIVRFTHVIGLWFWFFYLAKSNDDGRLTRRSAVIFFATQIMLAGLAVGALKEKANLHGRYLIGYYVSLVSLTTLGWAQLHQSLSRLAVLLRSKPFINRILWQFRSLQGPVLAPIASLFIFSIHGLFLTFILQRYF